MARYALTLEYKGNCFHGFQKQPDVETVQGALEHALFTLCGKGVPIFGAGRTDAGVHAVGQVACFDLDEEVEKGRFVRALNALVPEGLSVVSMKIARDDFDPRRDALWREYRYFILNRESPSPLLAGFAFHYPFLLDFEKMKNACALIEGEKDFSSFTVGKIEGSPVRKVILCDVKMERSRIIVIRIRANSFLYRMARIIAASIVSVGSGRLEIKKLEERISGVKCLCADPLPAHGLYLWKISYPSDCFFETRLDNTL